MIEIEAEKAKYEKAWAMPAYRNHSPGFNILPAFMQIMRPEPGDTLCDWGCGPGSAALWLHWYGLDVTLVDITEKCLNPVPRMYLKDRFIEHCLWEPRWRTGSWDFGLCADVMEHIPPEHVDQTLDNIIGKSGKTFFHICLKDDKFGKEIGEPLHLTVKPFRWWKAKLAEFGTVTEARHLLTNGLYVTTY